MFLLSTIASAFLLHKILADLFALYDPSLSPEDGDCSGSLVHILDLIEKSKLLLVYGESTTDNFGRRCGGS